MLKLSSTRLLGALFLICVSLAKANTIDYFTTVYDTNLVTSDIGMRDIGAGTLSVAGINGSVTESYLYWHGPTLSTDSNVNANVSFNGTAINGTNIGFSADNFWGSLNSQAYRANVSPNLTGNGNYSLSNFQKTNAQIN